jgi:hypothetical protein
MHVVVGKDGDVQVCESCGYHWPSRSDSIDKASEPRRRGRRQWLKLLRQQEKR